MTPRQFELYLIGFGIYAFIAASWSIAGYFGAPWVPTPLWKVDSLLKMSGLKKGETLLDLGAGDGRIVIWAALKYQANAIGVEIDPLRCLWANFLILILGQRKRARVLLRNIFDVDILPQADVVTVYLLQTTNQKLMQKLEQECKPASRILSRTFTFTGWNIARQDEKQKLYLYKK